MDGAASDRSRRDTDDGRPQETLRRSWSGDAEQEGLILGNVAIDLNRGSSATDVQEPGWNPVNAPIRLPPEPGLLLDGYVAGIGTAELVWPAVCRQQQRPSKVHDSLPHVRFGFG
jgi:hypothetical protein